MSVLTDLIRGRGAHADPLGAVADLTAEEAGRLAPGLPHSVWQLVRHLSYWMDVELRAIEGAEQTVERSDSDWPADPAPADEVGWRHDLVFFRLQLDQLATLAEARASTLARIVHHPEETHPDTVEGVLWQLVAHNSYHTGQIVDVRRAIGLWPPRSNDS